MAISIRLSPEDEARLEELARRTGRSKAFHVREAIREHLHDLEERFWADAVVGEWQESSKESRPAQQLWEASWASSTATMPTGSLAGTSAFRRSKRPWAGLR